MVGELLPRRIKELAKHLLLVGQTVRKQPKNRERQIGQLRDQFAQLGELASNFLEELLKRQRYGMKQAQRVLALLRAYERRFGTWQTDH